MIWLLKGFALGLAIAAPVGPIGVLAIQRTLAQGWRCGLLTGLGAATADAAYGAVAGFGLTGISQSLLAWQSWIQGIGGAFLCVLGVRTFVQRVGAEPAGAAPARGLLAAYLSTVILTLANPATILSFAAVFAGAGLLLEPAGNAAAAALVAGVFAGSAAWWLFLGTVVNHWRSRRLGRGAYGVAVQTGLGLGGAGRTLRNVNRVSGALLTGFGCWALLQLA